jgi:soluble lytic murein transglycosylase
MATDPQPQHQPETTEQNTAKTKSPKSWIPYALGGAGIVAMITGMLVSTQVQQQPGKSTAAFFGLPNFNQSKPIGPVGQAGVPSPVIHPLTKQSPQKRAEGLKKVAQSSQPSLDRSRARYVLANDFLNANQPGPALQQLENLENDYPVLGPKILQKRAIALTKMGKADQSKAVWQDLLKRYPQDPTAAEALYALGQKSPQYWDQAIAQFPTHPRSVEIAKAQLKKNPKQLAPMLLLAKAELDSKDTPDRLDALVTNFGPQLKPADWGTVAFAYWESQKYDKAADAYARAPQTALTAYRAARGLHLSGKPGGKQRYQQVVQQFPNTNEAGLALTRLAQVVEPQEAAPYLDMVIASYPDRAAKALLEKAKILDRLNSSASATQVRQYLLDKYPDSEPAAEMRWLMAQEQAKAGKLTAAREWAEAAQNGSPNQEIAAKAGFWAGKWALKLGDSKQAGKNFQQVIKDHPESYYAWRSASLLGWNVGDFNTVRQMQPTIRQPQQRQALLAGSAAVRELHQIGQAQDAWGDWQVEYQNRIQPTVAEQYTDGIMRLGVGDNLDALYMVGSLSDREQAEDQKQYRSLRTQADYWQTLYPFPFADQISNWSQQRQINPMLVTALIRQESRFEPQIKSVVGAAGLMQVMPETAEFIATQIKVKSYSLTNPEDSIKFGTWYLGHTHDEYSGNSMLAVASYNAGPGAVSEWLTASKSRDPDEFVEVIPYEETRGYVKSVFGNYWNYLRLYNPEIAQQVSQVSPEQPKVSN